MPHGKTPTKTKIARAKSVAKNSAKPTHIHSVSIRNGTKQSAVLALLRELGKPDYEKADAYVSFVYNVDALRLGADVERKQPVAARVLELDGQWRSRLLRHNGGHWFDAGFKGKADSGMSGSPIIDTHGAAIGLISTGAMDPRFPAHLPGWLIAECRVTILYPTPKNAKC